MPDQGNGVPLVNLRQSQKRASVPTFRCPQSVGQGVDWSCCDCSSRRGACSGNNFSWRRSIGRPARGTLLACRSLRGGLPFVCIVFAAGVRKPSSSFSVHPVWRACTCEYASEKTRKSACRVRLPRWKRFDAAVIDMLANCRYCVLHARLSLRV